MARTSPTATVTEPAGGRPTWLGEVLRLYPGFYAARRVKEPDPPPLPPGATGALLVPGMFCRIQTYGRMMSRIAARQVPVSGLQFGSNMWGTLGQRVEQLGAAVAAHAATGGRVVLVGHSMGSLVCARLLLDRPAAVCGFVSVCGVFGGLRLWTMLGWPVFEVVREMRGATGARLAEDVRRLLKDPEIPVTVFQSDRDEFVRDQSGLTSVVRFRTCVTHNAPILEPGALDDIAERVAAYASLGR